jgi:hypothetical protein
MGESSSRRSSGRNTLAFMSTMKSNDIGRLDNLGHSGGHHGRDGTLSAEGRRFLKFSELALFFLFLVNPSSFSVLEGSLLGLFRKDLIDEFDRVGISQVVIQFFSRFHDICSVRVGHIGETIVVVVFSHMSVDDVFAFTSVIFLMSQSRGRRVVSVIAVEVSHHFVETISILVSFPEFTFLRLVSGVHESFEFSLEFCGFLLHFGVAVH